MGELPVKKFILPLENSSHDTTQQPTQQQLPPTEEIIANIFASLLGTQTVSIHDNFFELGGHSLLATQLTSRLRQALNREIPLRQIFENPTVAQLHNSLSQQQPTQQQLPPIQPVDKPSHIPLSFAQERLWFLNQLQGESATYNIPAAIQINGELDTNALEQALAEIVRRHQTLRTSFPTDNGTPKQLIHPHTTINIKHIDLQHLETTETQTIIKQQTQQEAITPFQLETAPLIRCSLLQPAPTEHILLLTMHHIISDGWSTGILIKELTTLYTAFSKKEPSPLPELALQYADYSLWQRQWLTEQTRETQLQYWSNQLQNAPQTLQLPTDHTRPSIQTHRGRNHTVTINQQTTQQIQKLSGQTGTTIFMTLLAAFATLLYRYSGQTDILIGSPIANRHHVEIEPLIGFFVNTLVLRTQIEQNSTFTQLLSQVRETTLKAYENQDIPFEQLVEALQPQRSLSYSPLFQVMFVLQNNPTEELELPGLTCSVLESENTNAKFDLTLSVSETKQGLVCEWEYNTGLFEQATIERMANHYENLLNSLVANPEQAVSEIDILSGAEKQKILPIS